ncbi:MAG: hypothetical protein HY650_01150 [Acidobacteria bacterium]|nr:hypothetical protein [Acidobacteriota bacterium]
MMNKMMTPRKRISLIVLMCLAVMLPSLSVMIPRILVVFAVLAGSGALGVEGMIFFFLVGVWFLLGGFLLIFSGNEGLSIIGY